MIATSKAAPTARFESVFGAAFPEATEYEVTQIEGTIPEFLQGTYYVNGPARFERGGQRYVNWLDGDGMVCALRFDSHVHFSCRYVNSEKLRAEEHAGCCLYRSFGTAFLGDRLVRGVATASPVNVNVCDVAGKLLALGEQGIPIELDHVSLESIGPYDFDGVLTEVTPFSAHPKFDERAGEIVNFGISYAAKTPCLNLYCFDLAARLRFRKRIPLPAACSMHDFSLSERFAVFYVSPYILDVAAIVEGGMAPVDALSWRPELGSQLLILARDDGREVARLAIEPRYSLHSINSFEERGVLNVDVIEYDRPVYPEYQPLPELFADVPPGEPVRYTIDMRNWNVQGKRTLPYRNAPDFPAIDPKRLARRYDDVWMLGISATGLAGAKFFDELVHLNWAADAAPDVYCPSKGRYLAGEPACVTNPYCALESVILCHEFDPVQARSWFLIFDAGAISNGPVARLQLCGLAPPGFHATFIGNRRGR